jgi:hypothetical protein
LRTPNPFPSRFWDWASQPVPPKEVYALNHVEITTFDGSRAVVDNPLIRYHFDEVPGMIADARFREDPTFRYPAYSIRDGWDVGTGDKVEKEAEAVER